MNEEALSSSNSTSISSNSPSLSSASSSFSTSTSTPIESSTIQSSSPSDTFHSSYRTTSQPTPHYSKSTGFIASRDSYNSSYNFPRNCYLTAEANVNGVSGIVLLDIDSGVTIISSKHWKIIGTSDFIGAYNGPDIQGPDGSSIGAEEFPSTYFGNDYMKSIGLVLDLQANRMWLRQYPEQYYSISSDLTHAGRIDVPVISTEKRTIAPYHIAYIQVKVPSSVASHTWDASLTGHRSHIATANSLIRFTDRKSFVQIANCSSRQQLVYRGQHVALADLYLDDLTSNIAIHSLLSSLPILSSSTTWESPMPLSKEDFFIDSSSTDNEQTIYHIEQQSGSLTSFSHAELDLRCIDSNCRLFSHSCSCSSSSTPSSFILSAPSPSSPTFQSQSYIYHEPPNHNLFHIHSSSSPNLPVEHISSSQLVSSHCESNLPDSILHDSLSSADLSFLQHINITDTDLTEDELIQLKNLLTKYHTCFRNKPGHTSLTQHHIDTSTTKPIKLRPYRVSPQLQQIISQHINEMLTDGIIELASGPYAAPVTLQPKKDGSLRFCVDFRQLNSVTVRDVYPIPRIDDTLDQLQAAKYFTSLDLKSGFWQIELDDESRPKTAFITHAELFQFKVIPFGLTNAPATFQRLMDLVLGGLKWSCALVYLDDIIVYSSTFQSHLQHLNSVLERIQSSGLTLHISK
ncbi:unnamed protein product, partial [Rotaria magnacalcarata]